MTKAELRDMWESRVAEFRQSGMSVRAWCLKQQVSLCQMHYWLRKSRVSSGQANWVPVQLKEPSIDSGINVRVGNATIEVRPGFDEELLRQVVKALALC